MNADCPHCENVNALLAGELPPAEEAALTTHLETCATCRAEWESSRALLDRLRSLPGVEPSCDLAPLVLARARALEQGGAVTASGWRSAARRLAAVAALLAVSVLALFLVSPSPAPLAPVSARPPAANPQATPVSLALEWFVNHQTADGSWDEERWGGQRKFSPALTALPLLALITTGEPSAAHRRTAARAAMHLMEQQNPDGSFGPAFFGTPYNSSLSTLALLHTWQRMPEQVEKASLDAAVAALIRSQSSEGGWGSRHHPQGDLSITRWHIQALDMAARLGWDSAAAAAARGKACLTDRPASDPRQDPSSLNFYAAYFTIHSLKNNETQQAGPQLASLREQILQLQATEGEEKGSWAANDQWGRVGGRLYATALAALALGAPPATP